MPRGVRALRHGGAWRPRATLAEAHAACGAVVAVADVVDLLVLGTLRTRLKQHEATLAGWAEPDGELVPAEPDPDRRRLIRAGLEAVVVELRAVLRSAGR